MGLVHNQRPSDTAWPTFYSSSLSMLVSSLRGVDVKLTFPILAEAKRRWSCSKYGYGAGLSQALGEVQMGGAG